MDFTKKEEELPALQFPPHGTIEYDDKGIKVMWDENEGWVEQEDSEEEECIYCEECKTKINILQDKYDYDDDIGFYLCENCYGEEEDSEEEEEESDSE